MKLRTRAAKLGRDGHGALEATSIRWEKPFFGKCFAEFNTERVIDVEHRDGDSADGSPADKVGASPAKMPMPLMAPRVEEPRELARPWVNAGDVRALVAVVVEAGEGQITAERGAVMLDGDDVVDLERRIVVILGNVAVFATAIRTMTNELDQRGVHDSPQEVVRFLVLIRRTRRALDLRIESKEPALE